MSQVTIFSNRTIGKAPIVIDIEDSEEDTAAIRQHEIDKATISNRVERDRLLSESDWTQGSDSPLSDADKALWATYRTELRDITSHDNWPELEDADWPTKPS